MGEKKHMVQKKFGCQVEFSVIIYHSTDIYIYI